MILLMRGVAEGQQEIARDDSLPMNCNIDLMGGIDFKKGCYVGQELTIRTHHTGVVRRRVVPVMFYEHEGDAPQTLQYDPSTAFNAAFICCSAILSHSLTFRQFF